MKRIANIVLLLIIYCSPALAVNQSRLEQGGANGPAANNNVSKKTDKFDPVLFRDNDRFCSKLTEGTGIFGNVVSIGLVAVRLSVASLLNPNGTTQLQDKNQILVDYSKEHLWLPMAVEEWYGQFQHKKRHIFDRNDQSHSADYQHLDEVFGKLWKYVTKPPYTPRVYITDDPKVNAESLPGGYIYVSKGLLARHDDNLLAFMLVHEISHISKRHLSKQFQEKLVDSGIAIKLVEKLATSSVASGKEFDALMADMGVFSSMPKLFAEYNQNQEVQADACAVALITEVDGIDATKGFAAYLKTRVKATARKDSAILYSDHPSPPERQKYFNEDVKHQSDRRNRPDFVALKPSSKYVPVDSPANEEQKKSGFFGLF